MHLASIVPLHLHSADWAGLLMCVQVFKLSFTKKEVHLEKKHHKTNKINL